MQLDKKIPWRGVYQFLVLLIGVAFESIRNKHVEIEPFLLINFFDVHRDHYWMGSEAMRGYAYNFLSHIQWIAVVLMMWKGASAEDYKLDRVFFILFVLDFLDYILWGNNLWFSITVIPHENGFGLILPMSMNVLSLLVFGFYVFRQWKNGKQY